MASMGSLWFVTKLYNKPVVEHNFYRGMPIISTDKNIYVTGCDILQSSAQSALSTSNH